MNKLKQATSFIHSVHNGYIQTITLNRSMRWRENRMSYYSRCLFFNRTFNHIFTTLKQTKRNIMCDNNASRNIEIKAKICNDEEFQNKVKIAKKLSGTDGELIIQRDVFFKTNLGRLKLRFLKNKKSELILYDRPDFAGPKLSKFVKTDIDEPEVLEQILTASNGTRGIVEKKRYLYLHKDTRIHLDKVEGLGNFIEFEVCLRPEQSIEEGQLFAEEIMDIFGIKQQDLMTGAYLDEIIAKNKQDQ